MSSAAGPLAHGGASGLGGIAAPQAGLNTTAVLAAGLASHGPGGHVGGAGGLNGEIRRLGRPAPLPGPLGACGAATARQVAGRTSRPASCDSPLSPMQSSPLRRSLSNHSSYSSHDRRDRRPRREREDSNGPVTTTRAPPLLELAAAVIDNPASCRGPVDTGSPVDSLSELLGLHSRPSSYGGRNNGSAGRWQQQTAGLGQVSATGRPASREELTGGSGGSGGTRPPRAPALAGGAAGAIPNYVGGHNGSTAVGAGAPGVCGESRSRPSSRPAYATGTSPGRRHIGSASSPASGSTGLGSYHDVCSARERLWDAEGNGRPITPRVPPRGGGPSPTGATASGTGPSCGGGLGAAGVIGGRGGRLGLHGEFSPPQQASASPASPKRHSNGGTAGVGISPGPGLVATTTLQAAPTGPRAVSSSAPPWGRRGDKQTVAMVSLASDPNPEFRPYMEDGQKVVDPILTARAGRDNQDHWGYFAVYDGHGGRNEVDYCESKLHEVVLAELRTLSPSKDVKAVLTSAFAKIDGQLAMLGAWDSGCTATVCIAHRQNTGPLTLHVANVGDSRAVVVGENTSRRVSTDHRAADPAEARRVATEGGVVRHGRVGGQLSVSRSLGDHRLKSVGVSCVPDICSLEVDGNVALVIASDGLWDALEDDDSRRVLGTAVDRAVAQGGDEKAVADRLRDGAAKALVECAKERGSRDNILALVAFF
eukprot:TRINITY_DN4908_c1_g1_i1.p1 TRINITY_DN4908_c1_g1~~TRINITY_DN4908_c1_g1_i1.p1  ORF type:complete len:708 (-),score=92.45 TRINITY_DN4908_c1_g1_i1:94-2217(-)